MEEYHAIAEIVWQAPETIQKKVNLGQAIYAANIRFDGIEALWSVVLLLKELKDNKQDLNQPHPIKLGFLFPERVMPFLKPGLEFKITEGPAFLVGSGKILSIKD